MSSQTVHAIVLRRRDSGESDRRLTLLTEELGVFDAVAKGAKKAGSRLAGSSEPLAAAIFHLAKGKKLWYVTQAQPATSFGGLRKDFDRLSFSLALLEIAGAVLPHENPAPRAFRTMLESLRYLEVHPKPLVAAVWAELKLLDIAGLSPRWRQCATTGLEMNEAEPFVSPRAGGFVSRENAAAFDDRIKTRAEVLIGLERTGELSSPPEHLKFAGEAYELLSAFWRENAERPLPAREAAHGTAVAARLGTPTSSGE
jgi:DNA repair protein RecO (recombination protein O)